MRSYVGRPPSDRADRQTRVRSLTGEHTAFVTRTLLAGGVASHDVADEVQRTFITAVRRIDDIWPGAERGFLFGIATNVAAHARRSYARRREIPYGQLPKRADAHPTPEHIVEQKQLAKAFERILDSLDEPARAVFTLHVIDRLDTRETAAVLGIPPRTVASRLRRARLQLQANLERLHQHPF